MGPRVWRELREDKTLQKKLNGRNHLVGVGEIKKLIVSENVRPQFLTLPCSESKKLFSKENGEGKGTIIFGVPTICPACI